MMSNKKMSFTIIKDDPTDGHKGFGIGSISLENVTPLFIDVQEEEAYIQSFLLQYAFFYKEDQLLKSKSYLIL